MASIPPAILALLINLSGCQFFLSPVHFPISPLLSSIIFTFAAYFLLIQIDIYPVNYRKIPGLFAKTYEFFVFLFFLEFGLCNVWFPLETFAFFTLSSFGECLKQIALTWCLDSLIITGQILQHYITGIVVSYILSVIFLIFILHCTYLIDVTLIYKCGFGIFFKDAIESLYLGVQLVLQNNSCRWHTVGMRQEIKRQKKFQHLSKYTSCSSTFPNFNKRKTQKKYSDE